MSSNWYETSDGEDIRDATGEGHEVKSGFVIIADGTFCLQSLESIKWETAYQSTEQYVLATWMTVQPKEYAGQKVKQKLWIEDFDPASKNPKKKKDDARKALGEIDAASSGWLSRKVQGIDDLTDEKLAMAFTKECQMVNLVKTYPDRDDPEKAGGNWVSGNWPVGKKQVTASPKAGTSGKPKPQTKTNFAEDLDDDVPF